MHISHRPLSTLIVYALYSYHATLVTILLSRLSRYSYHAALITLLLSRYSYMAVERVVRCVQILQSYCNLIAILSQSYCNLIAIFARAKMAIRLQ